MNDAAPTPTRPILLYHGGKWKIAQWIVRHFPRHRVYVEPFCGAASVLLNKARAYCEIINDLDDQVVNLLRVLRDEDQAVEFRRRLQLTPYARAEFDASYREIPEDPIEAARLLTVRSFLAFSSRGATSKHRTGFRAKTSRQGTHAARAFANLPEALDAVTERLRGVLIENRPALEVIQRYDAEDGLIYCDPPYLHSTRGDSNSGRAYRQEMTDEDHASLAEVLKSCRAYVLVSGYPSGLYDELYRGWTRSDTKVFVDACHKGLPKPAVECLWVSPRTWEALNPPLFAQQYLCEFPEIRS